METNNYISVDYSSSYWDSLEMMTNYFTVCSYNKEDILLHLKNTRDNGYVLVTKSELNDLKTELEYYKRLYEKTL